MQPVVAELEIPQAAGQAQHRCWDLCTGEAKKVIMQSSDQTIKQ